MNHDEMPPLLAGVAATLAYLFHRIDRMDSRELALNVRAYRDMAANARQLLQLVMESSDAAACAIYDTVLFGSRAARDMAEDEKLARQLRAQPQSFPQLQALMARLSNKKVN